MQVIFRRTGERRYAVVVVVPGSAAQTMSPAPGFDRDIPHDLVHYVVEAELGLDAGVFGRASRGAGTFYAAETAIDSRNQARKRRKQARREQALHRERANEEQLETSERLAAVCDIAWRRRHGQRPSPAFIQPGSPNSTVDSAGVERVVSRLDQLAPLWNQLPVGGELAFTWPSLDGVSTPKGNAAPDAQVSPTSALPPTHPKPNERVWSLLRTRVDEFRTAVEGAANISKCRSSRDDADHLLIRELP